VVSKAFGKDTLVKRHQKIYNILDDELNGGVQAMALQTRTPQEYAKLGWDWRAK
jgi:stress-induced morphogen